MIIDKETVTTGSFNFTRAAEEMDKQIPVQDYGKCG